MIKRRTNKYNSKNCKSSQLYNMVINLSHSSHCSAIHLVDPNNNNDGDGTTIDPHRHLHATPTSQFIGHSRQTLMTSCSSSVPPSMSFLSPLSLLLSDLRRKHAAFAGPNQRLGEDEDYVKDGNGTETSETIGGVYGYGIEGSSVVGINNGAGYNSSIDGVGKSEEYRSFVSPVIEHAHPSLSNNLNTSSDGGNSSEDGGPKSSFANTPQQTNHYDSTSPSHSRKEKGATTLPTSASSFMRMMTSSTSTSCPLHSPPTLSHAEELLSVAPHLRSLSYSSGNTISNSFFRGVKGRRKKTMNTLVATPELPLSSPLLSSCSLPPSDNPFSIFFPPGIDKLRNDNHTNGIDGVITEGTFRPLNSTITDGGGVINSGNSGGGINGDGKSWDFKGFVHGIFTKNSSNPDRRRHPGEQIEEEYRLSLMRAER